MPTGSVPSSRWSAGSTGITTDCSIAIDETLTARTRNVGRWEWRVVLLRGEPGVVDTTSRAP